MIIQLYVVYISLRSSNLFFYYFLAKFARVNDLILRKFYGHDKYENLLDSKYLRSQNETQSIPRNPARIIKSKATMQYLMLKIFKCVIYTLLYRRVR